jgi:hypothetical protein
MPPPMVSIVLLIGCSCVKNGNDCVTYVFACACVWGEGDRNRFSLLLLHARSGSHIDSSPRRGLVAHPRWVTTPHQVDRYPGPTAGQRWPCSSSRWNHCPNSRRTCTSDCACVCLARNCFRFVRHDEFVAINLEALIFFVVNSFDFMTATNHTLFIQIQPIHVG